MSAADTAATGNTIEVRPEARFDERRLEGYLRLHLPEYAGPLTVRQFQGGQSNPSYLLGTPSA